MCTGQGRIAGGTVCADDGAESSFGKGQYGLPVLPLADMHAFSAQYAPVGVMAYQRVGLVDPGLFEKLPEAFGLQADLQESGDVLKLAFFIGVTVFAVHIVNRQKKAKGGSLQAPYGRGVGFDDHMIFDHNRARCDRLPFALDFDKAHPAGSRRAVHPFQIAQVRDVDPVFKAGLKQVHPFRGFYLLGVHLNYGHNEMSHEFYKLMKIKNSEKMDHLSLRSFSHEFTRFEKKHGPWSDLKSNKISIN